MKLNLLGEWLSWLEDAECQSEFDELPYSSDDDSRGRGNYNGRGDDGDNGSKSRPSRQFHPAKKLCERDKIIIDMLNSASSGGSTAVSFCITDPHQIDNPVVFISKGFSKLTGYECNEVVGRNCRFLQGPKTKRSDVEKIKEAIKYEKECSVKLLNYKKDGTEFLNEVGLHVGWTRRAMCLNGLSRGGAGVSIEILLIYFLFHLFFPTSSTWHNYEVPHKN